MIEVVDVYYEYADGTRALNGVSLRIGKGEIVAIMGENGAGKTTLVKHFNGLLKPTKGTVKINGIDTREKSVAELSKIVGIVFQNPDHQLFADTVEEEIKFSLKNFNFSEDVISSRIKWALKIMELEKYSRKSPYTLSVGERKRLAIASVLAYDPEIIVLDEPTAGQDWIQKEKISEIINLLKHMGKTIVIVTHDIEFVLERVNRIILMANGKIIADGKKREILSNIRILERARLIPPQIPHLSYLLYEKGVIDRRDILFLDELLRELEARL